jgi:hypothetical protein
VPIDGPAPTVVNAIRHAGLDVRGIPTTPEVLHRAEVRSPPRGAGPGVVVSPATG